MRHWLLTIRMAGVDWRYTTASESVEVLDGGAAYVFSPGLDDPAPTSSAVSVEGVEIPISVVLGGDAWEVLAGLRDMGGLTAELALWTEGDAWARRVVWADGRMDRPAYETVGQPLAFSIVEDAWEDRSLIPSPTQQINGSTWPLIPGSVVTPDGSAGYYYPVVFGAPGVLLAGDGFTEFFGWPVLVVEIDTTSLDNFTGGVTDATLLIAGHPMIATTVTIYNRTTGQTFDAAITRALDGLGQVVAVAYVAGVDLQIAAGDELWASCTSVADGGLGAPDGGVLRGAGQIAQWLMQRSTLRFDTSQAAMLARLDAFKSDFFISEPRSAWAILNDTVIQAAGGLLPAFWRRSRAGLYLAVRPWEGGVVDASGPVLALDPATMGGDRDGGVSVSSSAELVTDLAVDYARDEGLGATRRSLRYSPIPEAGATAALSPAVALASGRARRFLRVAAESVQDPATAALLLSIAARWRATTRRAVRYLLPPDERLTPGALVKLTDDEIRWNKVLCWVVSVQVRADGGFWTVDLEEIPDWPRQTGGA